MTIIPDDIPGNPEILGVAIFNGALLCATSDGLYSKSDGDWVLVKPTEGTAPLLVRDKSSIPPQAHDTLPLE